MECGGLEKCSDFVPRLGGKSLHIRCAWTEHGKLREFKKTDWDLLENRARLMFGYSLAMQIQQRSNPVIGRKI